MDFREVLTRRRSVRTYAEAPVPAEGLERIANAAVVWAPSAGFSQGLRIVVVTEPDTRRRIATAAKEDELAAQGRPRWKAAAPVHMVVLTREDDYHDRYRQQDKLKITGGREIDWPAPYWFVDAGAATMALMLAAIEEGLDTAIFGVTDLPALRETLGLPDDLLFVAVVTPAARRLLPSETARGDEGRAADAIERRRQRLVLVLHAHREREEQEGDADVRPERERVQAARRHRRLGIDRSGGSETRSRPTGGAQLNSSRGPCTATIRQCSSPAR